MNGELASVFNMMERERGLDREILIQAVEYALQSAARKSLRQYREVRVHIDRATCRILAFATKTVVERPTDEATEISLDRARRIKPEAALGDTIEVEVSPQNLGRIAAQTAKQAIIQRIRQAERDRVYEEYKDRVGQIVSGTVRQFNRGDILVDLGRAEAVLPAGERVPTEEYQIGDRIRAYVLGVQSHAGGPAITLSRSHPDFVRTLFRLEVAEIAEGVVEIKGIAREAGFRTKIAVASRDPRVDPVGACVGMRGMRVKNIVRELGGEKIDIVRWSDDLRTCVANALAPAKLLRVWIEEADPKHIYVLVDPDQLSLAIGKRGQNVRLTAKLLGVKIDVQREDSGVTFEEKVARAVDEMAAVAGVTREQAETLVRAGFLTVEGILAAELEELRETTGFDEVTCRAIYEAAARRVAEQHPEG